MVTNTIKTEFWPYEVQKVDTEKGITTYKEINATVDREWTDYDYSLSFKEDVGRENNNGNTGIWKLKGSWDETTRSYPYKGAKFLEDTVVTVTLSTKDKTNSGHFFNVEHIRLAQGGEQPSQAEPVQQAVTETQKLSTPVQTTKDIAISKGRAANSLTEILSAILSAPKTNDMKWFLDQTSWDNKEDLAKEWFESYQDSKDGKIPYMRIDPDELIKEIEENKEEQAW